MLKLNTIYNESCLETMKKMPDNFVDLVITSPPYDGLREYNGYSFDFEPIAKELYRVLKKGGIIVWIVNDATEKYSETLTSFKQAIYFKEKCGFYLYDTMIYAKKNPIPQTHPRYEQCFEYMFVFAKGRPKTWKPIMEKCSTYGKSNSRKNTAKVREASTRNRDEITSVKEEKQRDNIWYFTVGCDTGTAGHPAPFPERLVADHMVTWSNPDDLIYDPFMGSGTTGNVATKLKRQWIGSEISKEYYEKATIRIEETARQERLPGMEIKEPEAQSTYMEDDDNRDDIISAKDYEEIDSVKKKNKKQKEEEQHSLFQKD